MAARRWILFATALVSLMFLAWAGVLLAFSVRIDADSAALDADLAAADRAIVVPPPAPHLLATHSTHGADAAWLATGTRGGSSLPSAAEDVTLVLALAYVGGNASATPGNLTFTDVPARNGTANLTVDPAALSGGAMGHLVLDPRDESVRLVPAGEAIGEVVALETTGALALRFILGGVGFVTPLLALALTHRAARRVGPSFAVCAECRAPIATGSSFCLRCGAYAKEARADG